MLSDQNQVDLQLNKLEAKKRIKSNRNKNQIQTSPNLANSIISKTGCSIQTPRSFMICG
jgi:hypothetical protein